MPLDKPRGQPGALCRNAGIRLCADDAAQVLLRKVLRRQINILFCHGDCLRAVNHLIYNTCYYTTDYLRCQAAERAKEKAFSEENAFL